VLQYFYDGLTIMSRGTSMQQLEALFFPSPLMETWLSSIKWCLIKAGGRKNHKKVCIP
jgi:hypothetical protein